MNPYQAVAFLKKINSVTIEKYTPTWLIDNNYEDQAKVIVDPSKDISVLGTRRSGKTYSIAVRLLRAAREHDRSQALYIALTRDSAKSIMWPVLREIIEKNNVKAVMREYDLSVHIPNGSSIKLVGADMKNFMQRLRGSKYSEVAIDECQSWRSHVQEMVEEILKPALIDFNGALTIAGTPGPIKDGYFYNVTEKGMGGYSQHRLFMQRNPYLPNSIEWLEKYKAKMQWPDDHPTLRREYFGEWVDDPEALVYQFSRDRNMKPFDPQYVPNARYVMGLDIGFNDKTAISVIAYSEVSKIAWVVYSQGKSSLDVTDIAMWVRQIKERYNCITIECDTGGLGKTIAHELIKRHGIPVNPAEKTDKMSWIALLNDDLRQSKLFVDSSCTKLADQYMTLTKDEHGNEDPRLSNDFCVDQDTLIATKRGNIKIKDVKKNDLVLTRKGYKSIKWVAETSNNAEVLKIVFSNGTKLICTPNHPIYVKNKNEFVRADSLLYGDEICTNQKTKQLFTKAKITDAIQKAKETISEITTLEPSQKTESQRLSFYIGSFTKNILGQYQRVITYITRMELQPITELKTLRPLLSNNTEPNIMMQMSINGESQLKKLFYTHQSGTNHQKVENGTKTTLKNRWVNILNKSQTKKESALSAKPHLLLQQKQTYAAINAMLKKGATMVWMILIKLVCIVKKPLGIVSTAKSSAVHVVALNTITTRKSVWNISVNDCPEYYANGVLTHNCDSALYSYRKVYNYLGNPIKERPAYGTEEWARHEEEKAKEYAQKKYQEEFWNNDDSWI